MSNKYYSHPWEKLPQAILNLLDINSMYAAFDWTKQRWDVRRNGSDQIVCCIPRSVTYNLSAWQEFMEYKVMAP